MKNQIATFIEQLPPEYEEFGKIVIKLNSEKDDLQAENERLKNALEIATDYVRTESTRTSIGQLYDIEQALKG